LPPVVGVQMAQHPDSLVIDIAGECIRMTMQEILRRRFSTTCRSRSSSLNEWMGMVRQ
jgi:hypothetical protein